MGRKINSHPILCLLEKRLNCKFTKGRVICRLHTKGRKEKKTGEAARCVFPRKNNLLCIEERKKKSPSIHIKEEEKNRARLNLEPDMKGRRTGCFQGRKRHKAADQFYRGRERGKKGYLRHVWPTRLHAGGGCPTMVTRARKKGRKGASGFGRARKKKKGGRRIGNLLLCLERRRKGRLTPGGRSRCRDPEKEGEKKEKHGKKLFFLLFYGKKRKTKAQYFKKGKKRDL